MWNLAAQPTSNLMLRFRNTLHVVCIFIILGLEMNEKVGESEVLQLSMYSVGGHYVPHMDFIAVYHTAVSNVQFYVALLKSVIATFY